jgi:hypothetical protein
MEASIVRTPHRDENEPGIVAALEYWGCVVEKLSSDKKGTPDLLVATPYVIGQPPYQARKLFLVEIKNPKRPGKRKQASKEQQDFFDRFGGAPCFVVTSIEGARIAMQTVQGEVTV